MKTKLDLIKEAIEEGNKKKVFEIAKTITNEDIILDLVAKGYIHPADNCNFCNAGITDKFSLYGVCSNCYKELANKIVLEGNNKKINQIVEELKLLKKWS